MSVDVVGFDGDGGDAGGVVTGGQSDCDPLGAWAAAGRANTHRSATKAMGTISILACNVMTASVSTVRLRDSLRKSYSGWLAVPESLTTSCSTRSCGCLRGECLLDLLAVVFAIASH